MTASESHSMFLNRIFSYEAHSDRDTSASAGAIGNGFVKTAGRSIDGCWRRPCKAQDEADAFFLSKFLNSFCTFIASSIVELFIIK